MKAFQGIVLVLIWLIGLPVTISVAIGAAWSDTGGIDSGDAPSTGSSLTGWLVGLGGVALMVAMSVAVSRMDDEEHGEWGERVPEEKDPWDKWKL